ncbi:hypothetical protein L7F22_055620 [Adiantum nelumboides]|nr:hypothetical protein [Adiantum nelumboides]
MYFPFRQEANTKEALYELVLVWLILLHSLTASSPEAKLRMDGYKEEGSSSQDRQSNPTVHEVGEGSSQAEEGFPHVAFSITGTASPGTLFGGMQSMVPNPMYANIGLHPGFQGTQGQFGVSQGNLGMAGFSIPPVNMTPRHQHVTGQGVQMAPTGSMLNSSATSNLLETNSTAARPFPTGFSSQSGSTPIFPHTGNIPGLHNVHGSYNMSTVPSSLSSRNSGLGAAPGGPVHQPSGGLSTGRFANNTSLSQISHSGLHGRTGLNAGATGAFSGSMNGAATPVSGPSPGVNSRGTVSGLGVSPSMIGTGGPRITSSVSSMISGGVGSGLSRNLNSGTAINIPSFSGSRVNLGPSNMNGGLSIQGPGRPINNILQQASPQMVSILGNNFSSSVGTVGQGQSQATANGQLTSMGLMNDADGAAFDLNDFPHLSTRPSSAGSQGGLASLRKQVGVNPIVQQSQEFSIQNEDFPALPGFKGGSSDYAADVHQKDSQHESALALMQSQQFGA